MMIVPIIKGVGIVTCLVGMYMDSHPDKKVKFKHPDLDKKIDYTINERFNEEFKKVSISYWTDKKEEYNEYKKFYAACNKVLEELKEKVRNYCNYDTLKSNEQEVIDKIFAEVSEDIVENGKYRSIFDKVKNL